MIATPLTRKSEARARMIASASGIVNPFVIDYLVVDSRGGVVEVELLPRFVTKKTALRARLIYKIRGTDLRKKHHPRRGQRHFADPLNIRAALRVHDWPTSGLGDFAPVIR
jgi:hypothetical protein